MRSCVTRALAGSSRPLKGWARGSNHASASGYVWGLGARGWVCASGRPRSLQAWLRSLVYCLNTLSPSCDAHGESSVGDRWAGNGAYQELHGVAHEEAGAGPGGLRGVPAVVAGRGGRGLVVQVLGEGVAKLDSRRVGAEV